MKRLYKSAKSDYDYAPYSQLTREFMEKAPKIRERLEEYDKVNGTNFLNEFNNEINNLSKFFEKVDGDYFGNRYED